MAVASTVKFVQGLNVGTPGVALFGVLATPVVVSNGDNTGVVRWKFEVLDVPPGSAVPMGVVQDGALSTYGFAPDVRGGYLVRLTVFSTGNAEQSVDTRCFGVKEVSTRFIPPFMPIDVRGDLPLNFLGQLRGWAKYLSEWLYFIDALAAVPATRVLTAGSGLTGGGDLSADRTFNVIGNADGSIVANANNVQVGVLATDAQHGARGGGTQHAAVVSAGASGFMVGADKANLDKLVAADSVFTELAVDATTASLVFILLLTTSITITAGSILLIDFSTGTSNTVNNANNFFRIRIDGVVQRGVATTTSGAGNPSSAGMTLRVAGLAAGARTVDVQVRVSAGTGQIRPVTQPDSEHVSLRVQEVTA